MADIMYVCEHKWRQVPIGGVFPVKEPCLFYYLRKNKQCGNTNIVCVCVCVCVCILKHVLILKNAIVHLIIMAK